MIRATLRAKPALRLLSGLLLALALTACAEETPPGSSADAALQPDQGGATPDARATPDAAAPDAFFLPPTPDARYVCSPAPAAGSFGAITAQDGLQIVPMCRYRGMVLLIANVAAKCGFTPQMGQLQTLQQTYGQKGFSVLGFYSNQFLNQGGNEQERDACETSYGVTFPTFDTVNVNPPNEHGVFIWLKSQPGGAGAIAWNFEKFLLGKDGALIKRWNTQVPPTDKAITSAIEAALAK